MRVLKYLYLTKDKKLNFVRKSSKDDILDCCVDADWSGDKNNKHSTTGFAIRYFGNTIYWKAKKQTSVAKSSTAAEYVALSDAVSEIKIIKNILKDLGVNIVKGVWWVRR